MFGEAVAGAGTVSGVKLLAAAGGGAAGERVSELSSRQSVGGRSDRRGRGLAPSSSFKTTSSCRLPKPPPVLALRFYPSFACKLITKC